MEKLTLANIARNAYESQRPEFWKGLRLGWMQFDAGARTHFDFVQGGFYPIVGSTVTTVATKEGFVLDLTAVSSTGLPFGQKPNHCPTEAISVVCRILLLSEPASNATIATKGTVLTNDWSIARRTNNTYEFAVRNTEETVFSTVFIGARFLGGTLPRMVTFVLTYNGDRLKGYGDGVELYDRAANGLIQNTEGRLISLGLGGVSLGLYKQFLLYDRCLSQGEVRHISTSPYNFLHRRAVQPYWVLDDVPPSVFKNYSTKVFRNGEYRRYPIKIYKDGQWQKASFKEF